MTTQEHITEPEAQTMVEETEPAMEPAPEQPKARARIDIATDARRKAEGSARGPSARFIERLAERIGARAGVEGVFGSPIERDGRTVIPVAQTAWGVGGGTGPETDEETGSGAGGGTMSRPVGYLDITEERAVFVPLTRPWQDTRLVIAWAFAIWLVSRAVNRILRG
jgi:uncharacterized spore protein YtfJ